MTITSDIKYIGVNDHKIDLFEGQYHVPNGMSYNSYAIMDEKIAIMDSVDQNFTEQWLDNIQQCLKDISYLQFCLQNYKYSTNHELHLQSNSQTCGAPSSHCSD